MEKLKTRWPVWALAFASMAFGGAHTATAAEPATAAAAATDVAAPVIDAEAKALLMKMADFLARTQRYSVTVRGSYDAVQASGHKLEFNELRKVTVSRPDKLRVEAEHSDGSSHQLVYDGKEIVIASTPENVYAAAPRPGTIDDAVVYFRKDLRMRLPLAAMLLTTLPAELERRMTGSEYVEETGILGQPAHHLYVQGDTVDLQVWIAAGKEPVPLRLVLTYKLEEGQPQFRAQFADWNLSPTLGASTFELKPAGSARKIAFLSQLPRAVQPAPAADDAKGATP
jgi:hypothetical protein